MSLKIIYGKSGSGKSTYIFNEIANKIQNKTSRKIYIITPEQFSFTAEKKLLESVKTSAVISAEVLTFNRMAYRVMKEIGNAKTKNLSSTGKSMLIYNILSDSKKNLKFIGKSSENVELICTQITEFKKHGITVENLKSAMDNTKSEYLKAKIKDMLNIYEKYTDEISNDYIDENDSLTILAENLDFTQEFDNTDIYIDEFVGFTHQEYGILKKLLEKANEVNITVCTDDINLTSNPDTDVFYANKLTLDKIYYVARQENVKIDKPVFLENSYRFKNYELKHLEENIYSFPYKKFDGLKNNYNFGGVKLRLKFNQRTKSTPHKFQTRFPSQNLILIQSDLCKKRDENIQLFLAKNQYSEIEYVAENIVKLVRDKSYRYKEIAVITKDLSGYASLCKAIFNKYNIPVFIDEKKDLSQNVLVRYILSVINIFARNWSQESVMEYLKTNLVEDIDDSDICILENYALRWGIKNSKWYNGDWNFYDETEEEQEKILHIREKLVEPLLKFKKELSNQKDITSITKSLYQFIIDNHIDIAMEKKIHELEDLGEIEKAKEYETSFGLIVNILDEIVSILGDKKVSFDKYADILKIGLGSTGLGRIPGTQDQVVVGDVDRSRSHKVRAVFVIGLNDGMFPSVNKDEGFFNDNDREQMKESGAELAKGTIEKLYDDNFNIYKAFSTAEEKIYLSYSSSDLEGKSLRPSVLINRIKKIFPNLTETSDVIEKKSEVITKMSTFEELLNQLRDFRDGKEIDSIWFELYNYYSNSTEWKDKLENSLKALNFSVEIDKIDKEIVEKLYGNILKTSVSKLEQYKSCPFSYYLKYGLNLSEREEFKIQALDTGNFMHDVIDSFFGKLEERNIKVKELEKEELEEIVQEIIEEKLQLKRNYIFTSIPKYRVLANRLRKVIQKSIEYIVDSLKYSDFEVMGHEMEFKDGKEFPAIKMKLENGKEVEITGKIDRIDIAKTPEGNYIRIIDYKSSTKDINLNEVIAGLQLQLLTYLDAVCEIEDVMPAGVLYFNLIDSSVKSANKIDEEKLQDEIRKQFKMKGLILADVDIVKKMDKKLEKGSSNVVPAYIDKDGNLANKPSTITRAQFENLQKYTNKIIKQISEEILSGNIDVKPYYKIKQGKTPCEYCKYKSICNFNTGICKKEYNYIGNAEKEYILEQIKER